MLTLLPPAPDDEGVDMRALVAGVVAVGLCLSLPAVSSAGSEVFTTGDAAAPSTRLAREYGPPPFPAPTSTPGLPGEQVLSGPLDPTPSYVPQTSCDPREKRGITAFKRAVLAQYPSGKDWGSSRNCTDDGISEHLEGRAWDWNVNVKNPAQFAHAGQLLTWLTANNGYEARRLGIMYIGYNGKIWGAYRAAEGWRILNNSNQHTDHVHFSFSWNGALAKTSFWTGAARTEDYGPCQPYVGQPAPIRTGVNRSPCARPAALPKNLKKAKRLWRGSRGAQVTRVQKKLKVKAEAGVFGAKTAKAVAAYQKRKGLPRTGAVDAATWYALKLNKKAAK